MHRIVSAVKWNSYFKLQQHNSLKTQFEKSSAIHTGTKALKQWVLVQSPALFLLHLPNKCYKKKHQNLDNDLNFSLEL